MSKKIYTIQDNAPMIAGEPVVAYQRTTSKTSLSGSWNPNVPFHGTQEEWWDHFHRIERGHFTPLEEANKEFEVWKKAYLAKRLM